jgi:hypothetical protein
MVETIAISAGVVLLVLNQLGLLNWLKPKSASDIAAELELGDRRERRLEAKIVERDQLISELRQQRTNEPVLELVNRVFETQQQTLDKLAHFNGALKRNEEGLREATEALRMVAGLVVGAADLPVKEEKP